MKPPPAGPDLLPAVEVLISRVLFWGGLLSIAVGLLGLALYVGEGGLKSGAVDVDQLLRARHAGRPAQVFTSLADISRGLSGHPANPLALAVLGLLLLLATPVVGVALAIPAFLRVRDHRYVVIAGIVLVILIVSFVVGRGGG